MVGRREKNFNSLNEWFSESGKRKLIQELSYHTWSKNNIIQNHDLQGNTIFKTPQIIDSKVSTLHLLVFFKS